MSLLDFEDRLFKSLGACFVSAFAGSLILGLIGSAGQLILTIVDTGSDRPAFDLLELVWVTLQGLITSTGLLGGIIFILLCLFGLPVHALLCRFRLNGYIWHVLAATLFGMLLLKTLVPATPSGTGLELLKDYAFCGVLGFLYATIFWLIRRPDLDHKSQGEKPVTPTTTP